MIVRYTRRAVHDLEAIASYIRDRNPGAADRVRDRIEGMINGLADFPYQGSPTDAADVRRLVAAPFPYLIFYRVRGETVFMCTFATEDADPNNSRNSHPRSPTSINELLRD